MFRKPSANKRLIDPLLPSYLLDANRWFVVGETSVTEGSRKSKAALDPYPRTWNRQYNGP